MAAKPDLKNGWLPYAHELDAALSLADFSKDERIILRECFAQIFRQDKTPMRPFTLNARSIADRTGRNHSNILRAIRSLRAFKVIEHLEGKTYRFEKDYDLWRKADGTPRLTETEKQYCASAAEYACSFLPKKRTDKLQSNQHPSLVTADNIEHPPLSASTMPVVSPDNDFSQPRLETLSASTISAPAPYRNARGIKEREEEKERENVVVVVERAHETPKSQSIVDQVHAMIIAKSTDPEHMPRGNEELAEDIAMKASGWIRDGISPSAILEAYRLACEAVENPWKVQPYAAKVVRSLDNKLRTEATAPTSTARPSIPMRPVGLSPANQRRAERKAAWLARSPRKGGANG